MSDADTAREMVGLVRDLDALLDRRKREPAALMRQDHPQALEVAVARSNAIDRAIAEKLEANWPAVRAELKGQTDD